MQDIRTLVSGFQRFRKKYFHTGSGLYDELQKGQKPKALMIACSDSRVDPAILTDCRPGDLFVIRNVANLVPPYEDGRANCGVTSAVEYAVRHLHVKHIIVNGHSNCGGVAALLGGENHDEFIGPWIRMARGVCERVRGEEPAERRQRACEMAVVRLSLDNLRSCPWIAEKLTEGRLRLHGWYFDMSAGELLDLNHETGRFETLAAGVQGE